MSRKIAEYQRDHGAVCWGCAKVLLPGEGVIRRYAAPYDYRGTRITHGLYCRRGCPGRRAA